jgi:hypothetical protein
VYAPFINYGGGNRDDALVVASGIPPIHRVVLDRYVFQRIQDDKGRVLHRLDPDEVYFQKASDHHKKRTCLPDAVNNGLGKMVLTLPEWKEARKERDARSEHGPILGDYDMRDAHLALASKGSPYSWKQVGRSHWPNIFKKKWCRGIFIVHICIVNKSKSKCYHFFVIDLWRGLILDNSQETPIHWPSHFTHKQVRNMLGFDHVIKMYKLLVDSDRREETQYV